MINNQTNGLSYYIKKTSYLFVIGILIVAIFAPFTFMKPETVNEVKPIPKVVIENPLHKVVLPNFLKIKDVKEKKRQFFSYIRPAIEKQNSKILGLRTRLKSIKKDYITESKLSNKNSVFLKLMNTTYKNSDKYDVIDQIDNLLRKVDIVPVPMVLVQAANESAWGTSRFAKIGLNFFGMWCFEKGCGMIPRGRTKGDTHEVASFNTVEEAVTKYLYNINTNAAYQPLRDIRAELRQQGKAIEAEKLVKGLIAYSERGNDYVVELTNMLRHNRQYF